MKEENSLNEKEQKSLLEEIGLATYRDGFAVGVFIALILKLGIIEITTSMQSIIVFILLSIGVIITINKAFSRSSLISPPWDGFFSGFGVVFGVISLIETYLLPSL